jgi:hypothetical protein
MADKHSLVSLVSSVLFDILPADMLRADQIM